MSIRVEEALNQVREAVRPYPKAAMFELRDQGYDAIWQQLCACVLSIRTRDEASLPASLALLNAFSTPHSLVHATADELLKAIGGVAFAVDKVETLRRIASATVAAGGELPPRVESLTAIKGIGPKCAHLALGVAVGKPLLAVDIHVHRIANRWGVVATRTPEETLAELEPLIPPGLRVETNALLVPFGKHVCAARPRCPTCPLRNDCPKIGVSLLRMSASPEGARIPTELKG